MLNALTENTLSKYRSNKKIQKQNICWMTRYFWNMAVLTGCKYSVKISYSKYIWSSLIAWNWPLHTSTPSTAALNQCKTFQASSLLGFPYPPKHLIHEFSHLHLLITVQLIFSALASLRLSQEKKPSETMTEFLEPARDSSSSSSRILSYWKWSKPCLELRSPMLPVFLWWCDLQS